MMNSQLLIETAEIVSPVHSGAYGLPAKAETYERPMQEEESQTEACIVVETKGGNLVGRLVPIRHPITLPNALRFKCAEYWLDHGQPDEALRELEKLPRIAWNHPWAIRIRGAAVVALRELNGQAHAE